MWSSERKCNPTATCPIHARAGPKIRKQLRSLSWLVESHRTCNVLHKNMWELPPSIEKKGPLQSLARAPLSRTGLKGQSSNRVGLAFISICGRQQVRIFTGLPVGEHLLHKLHVPGTLQHAETDSSIRTLSLLQQGSS